MLSNDARKSSHEQVASGSDSILWFVLTVLIGLGITAYLFVYFVRLDMDGVERRLQRGLGTMAFFASQPGMDSFFLPLLSALDGIQREVYAGAEVSDELLQKWLWKPALPGLDTATLEYLPRVNKDNLAEFTAGMTTAESQGFMMLHETATGFVPASPQDEYFPVMIEAYSDKTRAPVGLDRSNNELIHLAMLEARDSGVVAVYTSFPLARYDEHDLRTHYFLPMYASGSVPATIAERRELLTGFIAISSYQPSVELFTYLSEDFQGIDSVVFNHGPDLLTSDPEFARFKPRLRVASCVVWVTSKTGRPLSSREKPVAR